jgi:hypothetical protein
MRMQPAPVTSRRPAAQAIPPSRPATRASILRKHSYGEKLTTIAGAAVAIALLVGGGAYTMSRGAAPPPREKVVVHPFAQGRVARIVMEDDDGACREHSFDNDRGGFGASRSIPCHDNRPKAKGGMSAEGFSNFKQAFGGK